MSPSAGVVLGRKVLAVHGARPDLRLWRNETGVFFAGRPRGRINNGVITLDYASRVAAGLCPGSADYIGILKGGRFLSMEIKAGRDRLSPEQLTWNRVVESLGGLVLVVSSVEEATAALGEAP